MQKPVLLVGVHAVAAAEMILRALRGALTRIDLSAVVSKVIGETEANLRRVFAEAHASGAVLLFDEADSLFGKRSTVTDAHDRYAGIELLMSLTAQRARPVILVTREQLALPASLQGRLTIRRFPPGP